MTYVSSQGEYGYDSGHRQPERPSQLRRRRIYGYSYASATTAGETTAGDALGYLKSETLYRRPERYDGRDSRQLPVLPAYRFRRHGQ